MTADKMKKKTYFFFMKLIKNYYLFLNKVFFYCIYEHSYEKISDIEY